MLGIFKEKRTASSIGSLFASRMPQLLSDTSTEALQLQFQRLVDNGANSSRIRPEIAALHCFLVWVGISTARQRNKITETGFNNLIAAYFDNLQVLADEIDVSESASLSYSSFGEWLTSRIDRYVSIATTITSEREVFAAVVDNFCDFACDGPPSAGLKLELLNIYVQSSGKVLDILAGTRLQ